MTERTSTTGLSRRTALKVTAGALVAGGGLTATGGGTTAAAQQAEDDEEEELPPEVADAAGVEMETGVQQAQAAGFHRRQGWRIRIQYTSDDRQLVRGGDYLGASCWIENNNSRGTRPDTATVWFVVGRDPDVVDRQTVSVWGQSSVHSTVGYETYPVRQIDRFPVWVLVDGPGRNDWDMTEVVVYPVG